MNRWSDELCVEWQCHRMNGWALGGMKKWQDDWMSYVGEWQSDRTIRWALPWATKWLGEWLGDKMIRWAIQASDKVMGWLDELYEEWQSDRMNGWAIDCIVYRRVTVCQRNRVKIRNTSCTWRRRLVSQEIRWMNCNDSLRLRRKVRENEENLWDWIHGEVVCMRRGDGGMANREIFISEDQTVSDKCKYVNI